MKNLGIVTLPMLLMSCAAMAENSCGFDYGVDFYVGYSKGTFDVKNQGERVKYTETHNNASRAGGSLLYSCGETTVKYTYSANIDYSGSSFKTDKIINMLSVSNDSYGSLTLGRLSTPYKVAGKQGDPFWDTAAGTVRAGNNFGFSNLTRGFTRDSIIYSSPSIGNFNLKVGYSGSNSDGDLHHGIEYQESDSVVGIQYINMGNSSEVANGAGSENAVRVYGRQVFDSWLVTGSIESVSKESGGKSHFYNVSAEKPIDDFGRVALSYGQVSVAKTKFINGSAHEGDGYGVSAGGFYNWTPNTEIYLLTSLLEFSEDSRQRSLVLGINYNFRM